MNELKVVISKDEMAAFVVLTAESKVSSREVMEELQRCGVVYGVSQKAVLHALGQEPGTMCQVAWGFSPEPLGEEAYKRIPRFIPAFPQSKGKPPETIKVDEDFRSEWKSLLSRGRVREGIVLGSLRYPDNALWRKTVTGKRIPYFGGRTLMIPGENAALSENGTSVMAKKKGIPYYLEGNTAGVMDRIIIDGDVSSMTQDVEFPGDLIIKGSILRGFSVSAWGSVMVDGSVFGSCSCAGDLLVSGGINGLGQSIEVGGSVSARFLENCVVRAWGQVAVTEAILHSVVESEDKVTVKEPGRIVGGLVRAKAGVIVGISGTHLGIPTIIEVGLSPRERREFSRLRQDLDKVDSEINRLKLVMPRSLPSPPDVRDLDSVRAQRELKLLEDRKKSIVEKILSLEERLSRLSGGFFWAEKVYPGTRVFNGLKEVAMPKNPGPVRIGDI